MIHQPVDAAVEEGEFEEAESAAGDNACIDEDTHETDSEEDFGSCWNSPPPVGNKVPFWEYLMHFFLRL